MRSWIVSRPADLIAVALAVLLACLARPAPQDAPPAQAAVRPQDASALLASFAKMNGLEAAFEEEKQLALLAAPLKSRGRLYFLRPGYLARVIEAPEPSTLTITPGELQMSGKDGIERIDLRQRDDVRLFVTSLLQVFLGDESALKVSFVVAFESSATDALGWTLTLTPRGPPLDKLMRELRLQGAGFAVTQIELREPGGDRTVTRIVKLDAARVFTDAEKTALFGIPPP